MVFLSQAVFVSVVRSGHFDLNAHRIRVHVVGHARHNVCKLKERFSLSESGFYGFIDDLW